MCRNSIILLLVAILFFCACKKDPSQTTNLLKQNSKGISGQVLVFDEFGDSLKPYDNISVVAECLDKSLDTNASEIDTTTSSKSIVFATLTDKYGRYVFQDAPTGYYIITCQKQGFGTNQIYNFNHNSSRGDSIKALPIAKKTFGKIEINNVRKSPDNKIIFIERTVELTGESSREYAVTSHFFFGKTKDICDTNYTHEWVSGATQGFGGLIHKTEIKKSAETLLSSGFKESDTVFFRAYVDNLVSYGYNNGSRHKIYPNISNPSEVHFFVLDSLVNAE